MTDEQEYRIRIAGSFVPSMGVVPRVTHRGTRGFSASEYFPMESKDISNKEIENLLKGLLRAFENSSTEHYVVRKAKTSIITTRTGEGKLEVSLGFNIFKLFDADGKVTGERKEGIEIEIERV